MKKVGIVAVFACAMLYGGPLTFESGTIKAHTEVFGDSTIDPMFKKMSSHLVMEESPASLHGSVDVSVGDFFSDNKKRDEHMHEALESSVYPKASFEVKEVLAKGTDKYVLNGNMNLHGVTKAMSFEGTIVPEGNKVHIKAASSMKMSDFGVKPPKMVFVSVRDQVDLGVDIVLKR